MSKSLLIALRSLQRNRLQTALTTMGMTIGVATVLVMVAVGSGAERSIDGQVRAAGMNVIVVTSGNYKVQQQWTSQGEAEEPASWQPSAPGSQPGFADGVYRCRSRPGFRRTQNMNPQDNPIQQMESSSSFLAGRGAATTLSLDDAAALAHMGGVQAVSGGMHENVSAQHESTKWLTQIRGEQVSLPRIRRAWVVSKGRFFTEAEENARNKVAVLGSISAQRLFGDRSPVGEDVNLRSETYRVVGVIASGSWMVPSAPGDGQFDAVYLPIGTAQALFGRSNLDTVTLATESSGDVTRVIRQLTANLRQRHRLAATVPDDFTVTSQARSAISHGGMRTDISRAMMGNAGNLDKVTLAQLSKTLERAGRTMAFLLASIAAVSLIVGGIGIMNIMLLSVTERTPEIGVRRAVGAQSTQVMQQFLTEAVVLSVFGGVLGIALGCGTSVLVARAAHWTVEISWAAVATSFVISAAVGILFGFYPAQQASRVSPLTSLRYE